MKFVSTTALRFLMVLVATAVAHSQETSPQSESGPTSFATPVRIMAGDKFLGADRLYPSPTFHDLNHDGLLDVVIGDLPGQVTVAYRDAKAKGVKFGPKAKVLNRNGNQLKFSNW